jgi:hypothetical protein
MTYILVSPEARVAYACAMTNCCSDAPIDERYAQVQHRWRELSACAAGIVPTRIPLEPAPGDIETVADDLRVLARRVDALIAAYGHYIDAMAGGVDRSLFHDVLFNAIDGNALYEIEQASQQLRDDIAAHAYYAAYNPSAVES